MTKGLFTIRLEDDIIPLILFTNIRIIKMKKHFQTKKRGFIAILVVVFVVILITIITFSLSAAMIGNGQGLNADGTTAGGNGTGGCTDGKISQGILDQINKNKNVYQEAGTKTGVPWEMLATIHYRESTNDPNKSLMSGERLGTRNPDNGVTYNTLLDSAIAAGGSLKDWAKYNKKTLTANSDDDTIKTVFLGHNRGFMYSRAGCTYDQSPYVMNQFDAAHKDMKWPDNACEVKPPATITKGKLDGQIGAFTLYSILKGNIAGAPICNEQDDSSPDAPSGKICGVVNVATDNIDKMGGDYRLMPVAANDFNKMAADFKAQTGRNFPVASMFRTREKQVGLCKGTYINSEGKTKCKNSLANPPGNSMHEAGLAIDTSVNSKDSRKLTRNQYRVLVNIMGKYNFELDNTNYGAGESWHLDYIGTKDKYWYGQPKITNAINAANSTNCN